MKSYRTNCKCQFIIFSVFQKFLKIFFLIFLPKYDVVGDGQGGLACCSPWGCKELDTTE